MTRIPLLPGALRAILKRREAILIADERAAVQAAHDSASPAERAEVLRLLGWTNQAGHTPGPQSGA